MTTQDLPLSAFNLLCLNPPEHYDCTNERHDGCDGCDWDALQPMIAKHLAANQEPKESQDDHQA